MSTRLLLLLSLFVFSVASYAEVGKSSEAAVPASGSASVASNPYSGMPEGLSALDQTQADRGASADRVCLNIHAFIFKTNDDRVPQLVRETTCMPVSGGTKKVNEDAQPKLVPATGGNSF